jgi:hypothetical protein
MQQKNFTIHGWALMKALQSQLCSPRIALTQGRMNMSSWRASWSCWARPRSQCLTLLPERTIFFTEAQVSCLGSRWVL